MPLSRRQTILAAGAGGLALVGAGAWWRVSRLPQTAAAPWTLDPTPPADVRLDAFRHAILAPNPHNRQPWRIRLDGSDGATLFVDLDSRLPQTDPYDRQITIGVGAFLELARLVAAERGHRLLITPFPEGEPEPRLDARPVAALRFVPDAAVLRDPELAAAIVRRRSDKNVYDVSIPLTREELRLFHADGERWRLRATQSPRFVDPIREQVVRAIEMEMRTPRAHRESVDLMRIGAREVDATPDGLELTGPMIEAGSALGMVSRESLADPQSSAFAQGLQMLRDTYGSASAFFWIVSLENSRARQLEAGAAYVRANLAATVAGLSVHPMSQSLQEYPQVAGPFAEIHRLLAPEGGRVQMLARVGHGPGTGPTPRWPLETRLLQN
jgi:hypothetical protein